MADHEHVEVLLDGVHRERTRGIGRRRQRIRQPGHLDDVRRMSAAGALGMVSVDGSAVDRANGVLDESGLVDRVGVNRDLHVELVGDTQARVDSCRRTAPVFVQLEPDGAGADLLAQTIRAAGVALTQEAKIHRIRIGGLQHAGEIPGTRCAGSGVRACARSGAAAEHGGNAGGDGLTDLLRSDEVDMRVDPAGREDQAFTGDDVGTGADDQPGIDSIHNVRIAGFADGADQPVFDAHVGLDNAPVIDNQGIGDDQVRHVYRGGGLAHAIANCLASAELDLVTIDGAVFLDLDDQVCISQADPVSSCWPVQRRVAVAVDFTWHAANQPTAR